MTASAYEYVSHAEPQGFIIFIIRSLLMLLAKLTNKAHNCQLSALILKPLTCYLLPLTTNLTLAQKGNEQIERPRVLG
jgi:hypothetical protein